MTRADLRLIASLIPECSRVLDLGCGNGELLRLLEGRGCHGTGVEIEPELFSGCAASWGERHRSGHQQPAGSVR